MKLFILLALIIGGLVAYVRFLEKVSLFFPTTTLISTPDAVGMPYQDVFFPARGHVTLHGWLIKAPAPRDPQQQPTLIYMHGNAGNIGDRVEKVEILHRMGLNILIFDYRGYGKSTGRPTEEGMYADARAAADYLRGRQDIGNGKVIYYGVSLGGAAAVDLAAHEAPAALMVDSTFSSGADMARRMAPFVPSFLLSVKLDSIRKIRDVKVPKLFIHSPQDEVVPFTLGRKLFEAAPGPKAFLQTIGGHNDGWLLSREIFIRGVTAFLKQNGLLQEDR